MTDITERLRIKADMILMCEKIKFGSDAAVMQDAAVEIERLREANELMLTDIRRTDVDMLAFKAEIERYRKTLRDIVRQCNNPIHTCPAGMDRIIERIEEMAIDALGPKTSSISTRTGEAQ